LHCCLLFGSTGSSAMAEQAVVGAQADDGEIFVYTGGDQVVPMDVRRVRIDTSVKIIPRRAFYGREDLYHVEFHDGIERLEKWALNCCTSLRGSIRLLGVKFIGEGAFASCEGLTDVEFGVELETIEGLAFVYCESLRSIIMPSARSIGRCAFAHCEQLTDLDLPEGLETIEDHAFNCCNSLGRIAIPLRDDMIGDHVFYNCLHLTTVALVGWIHKTVASLHLKSWRSEMKREMNRINQALPNTTSSQKTVEIQEWMKSGIRRINHYKVEHKTLLKEATTLLELALWKANLDDNEGGVLEREGVRTTRGRRKRARREICVTSGASIVIKNVLPFLILLE